MHGANTKANKLKIRSMGYHYLTRIPKKVRHYRKHIRYLEMALQKDKLKHIEINKRNCYCVKRVVGEVIQYIFFCPELYKTQIIKKMKKFEQQKKKGNRLLRKRKPEKIPSDKRWVMLIPHLQKTLFNINNPYVNGLECFFVLESSIDDDPEKILRLYEARDKAEKFIRALKEDLELRPIRHWNKWCVIGTFFICFITNFLINLTQTVVYPRNGFRFYILSNVTSLSE